MKKIAVVCASALLMLTTLTGCGYSGFFRYPCQDPANWEAPECKPPICDASGTCTKDVIKDPNIDIPVVDGTTVESGANG